MKHVAGKLLNGVLGLGVALLALQSVGAMRSRAQARPKSAQQTWVNLRRGDSLPTATVSFGPESRTVSSIGAGSCRLLIVFSATCGASSAAMKEWQRLSAQSGTLTARGWTLAWISADDSATTAVSVPKGFRYPIYFSTSAQDLPAALGVEAFPAHIVLGRDGRVVEADIGATMPESSDLRDDCSIVSARRPPLSHEE